MPPWSTFEPWETTRMHHGALNEPYRRLDRLLGRGGGQGYARAPIRGGTYVGAC